MKFKNYITTSKSENRFNYCQRLIVAKYLFDTHKNDLILFSMHKIERNHLLPAKRLRHRNSCLYFSDVPEIWSRCTTEMC